MSMDMSNSLVPLEIVTKILNGILSGQAKMVSYEGTITTQRNMLDTEHDVSVVECRVAFIRKNGGKEKTNGG